MKEIEISEKIHSIAPSSVILFRGTMTYYAYGRDITVLREVLNDRVFTTSHDYNGQEIYLFNSVNLSEVLLALARSAYEVIIVDNDMMLHMTPRTINF